MHAAKIAFIKGQRRWIVKKRKDKRKKCLTTTKGVAPDSYADHILAGCKGCLHAGKQCIVKERERQEGGYCPAEPEVVAPDSYVDTTIACCRGNLIKRQRIVIMPR